MAASNTKRFSPRPGAYVFLERSPISYCGTRVEFLTMLEWPSTFGDFPVQSRRSAQILTAVEDLMKVPNELPRRSLIKNVVGVASMSALIHGGDLDTLLAQEPASGRGSSKAPNPYPPSSYPWFAAVTDEDLHSVEKDIPEIAQLQDPDIRHQVTLVYASFLKESTYKRVSEAPWIGKYDLARHSRQVAQLTLRTVKNLNDFWKIPVRQDIALAAAILHDSSLLVENEGAAGKKSELGNVVIHGYLAGVRSFEVGLPTDVCSLITRHPFVPPRMHQHPPNIEAVVLWVTDLSASDPMLFLSKLPTHMEIADRFFDLDSLNT